MKAGVRQAIRWGLYLLTGLAVALVILFVVGVYSAPVIRPSIIT